MRMRFYATGTPILHAEASFISAERGLHRGISSWTSLKCYIHFSFILKLIIFIYKQLRRPVAFSAVQNGPCERILEQRQLHSMCQQPCLLCLCVICFNCVLMCIACSMSAVWPCNPNRCSCQCLATKSVFVHWLQCWLLTLLIVAVRPVILQCPHQLFVFFFVFKNFSASHNKANGLQVC